MKMLVNLFRNVIRQAFHRFEFFQGSLPDALHAAKKLQQHTLACIANSFDLIKLARDGVSRAACGERLSQTGALRHESLSQAGIPGCPP